MSHHTIGLKWYRFSREGRTKLDYAHHLDETLKEYSIEFLTSPVAPRVLDFSTSQARLQVASGSVGSGVGSFRRETL